MNVERASVARIRGAFWRVDEGGHWWEDGELTAPRWLRALVWCFLHDADRYEPFWRVPLPKWALKNGFEVKHARRVLIETGTFAGAWSEDVLLVKSPAPPARPW